MYTHQLCRRRPSFAFSAPQYSLRAEINRGNRRGARTHRVAQLTLTVCVAVLVIQVVSMLMGRNQSPTANPTPLSHTGSTETTVVVPEKQTTTQAPQNPIPVKVDPSPEPKTPTPEFTTPPPDGVQPRSMPEEPKPLPEIPTPEPERLPEMPPTTPEAAPKQEEKLPVYIDPPVIKPCLPACPTRPRHYPLFPRLRELIRPLFCR